MRHGRTEWNLSRRAQGHADVPLDDVGRKQAAAAASLIASMRPARLWSSDLARARQTAAYVATASGLAVEEDPRLREFSVGERQGLTWQESIARFPWISGGIGLGAPLADVPGAETVADVAARVGPALEDALDALDPGQTGVVVGHGAALKLALAELLGWPESMARTLSVLDNSRWSTVLVRSGDGERRLLDYGVGDFASKAPIG